jgi:alpha-beta hydrolase superfamily lysophospholipase
MLKEYYFHADDGQALFAREWIPDSPNATRAVVILVHGIGEHSGRYAHVAQAFNEKGIALLGFDLRGHGLSHGARGDVPSYARLYDDIATRIQKARADWPNQKIVIYGHSLGGNLVLNYVLRRVANHDNANPINGVIASSPELRLGFKPPAWKLAMAYLLAMAAPGLAIASGLDVNALSHDPEVMKAYKQDPLVHDRVTSRLFLGFSRAGEWALSHAKEWPASAERALPLLLSYGTADRLISPNAVHEFAQRIGSPAITEKAWDGFFHECHNELEKRAVLEAYLQWIDSSVLVDL